MTTHGATHRTLTEPLTTRSLGEGKGKERKGRGTLPRPTQVRGTGTNTLTRLNIYPWLTENQQAVPTLTAQVQTPTRARTNP